jgi:hypothetical protein
MITNRKTAYPKGLELGLPLGFSQVDGERASHDYHTGALLQTLRRGSFRTQLASCVQQVVSRLV